MNPSKEINFAPIFAGKIKALQEALFLFSKVLRTCSDPKSLTQKENQISSEQKGALPVIKKQGSVPS